MTGRRIRTAAAPLDARVRAVPSKSVTHRALVAAALATGPSTLLEPLDAEDTRITREGIRSLGIPILAAPGSWVVSGHGGPVQGGATLRLGASGTSFRFLLALASLGESPSRLEGDERLGERPILELADALREMGGHVVLPGGARSLPATVGGAPPRGGTVGLRGRDSSQYASALMLVGSRLPEGIDLRIDEGAVSLPYVRLTADVLTAFGVSVASEGPRAFRIARLDYRGREVRIEGDHSSASYFLAAAAIVGGVVRVDALRPDSAQPDAVFPHILETLGCEVRAGMDWIEVRGTGKLPAFHLDLAHSPDLGPTLAAMALFADGPCVLSGIEHLRSKESDRLEVLARNIARLGRDASTTPDSLVVGPKPPAGLRGGMIATASDHRIAMAFATAGLRLDGIEVDDSECVAKSNGDFWRSFELLEPERPIRTGS